MATSGSATTTSSESRSLTLSWSRSSTSYANNTSTISWSLKGSGSASGYVKCGGLYVKINGSVKVDESTDTRYTVYNGTSLKSGTATITHSNDGTKTFNVTVKAGIYQYARNCSVSKDFTLDALTRTVTYNGNGSTSGSVSSQTKTYGTALTLRSNGYTKTGYDFVKWNTKADGTGTSYNAGASFTSEVQSTTLYAQWSIKTYTVSYNANGGSGAPSSQTKTYGTALTLSSTVPTRSGWTFVGWGTSATATTKSYSAGGSYTSNAAITLYAIWSKTLTLSYSANGGSGAPSSQSTTIYNATTSATFTISSTKPTLASSNFQGWATSSTATSKGYDSGGSITISANTTLYAVWTLKTYTVSYNLNGGSGTFANQTKTYGTALTLHSSEPTLTGYLFQGWATSADGDVVYQAGGSYTTNAAVTLYAVWLVGTKIKFTFTQPSYTIDCDDYGKAVVDLTSIPYTTTTTTENADLPFYIKVRYKTSGGAIFYVEGYENYAGGYSPTEIAANPSLFPSELPIPANSIKNFILGNKTTENITFTIDTYTAEKTEEMKTSYNVVFDAVNYTKPEIKYDLVYRNLDGTVSIKIRVLFPKSFTSMSTKAAASAPTLVCNGTTLSLTPTVNSLGDNVFVYSYTIPAASANGRSTLEATYTDGLFSTTKVATIAATNADQVFKILRSGASRAMSFVQDDSINGLKIFKDCRAYGKDFNEREDA